MVYTLSKFLQLQEASQKKSLSTKFLSRFLLCIALILFLNWASAQSFKGEQKGIISDKVGSEIIPSFFPLLVSDLAKEANYQYGLEKVCFHIKHKRPTDLKIELLSPSGVSVWLSNRNGEGNTYGYLNTCVVQNGFNGPVHNPERFFQGEYSAEGRLNFLNNNKDPNGMWLLIVTDLREGVVGKLEEFSLHFGSNPAKDQHSSCTTDNSAACTSTRSDGKLLPDLIISESLTKENIHYFDSKDKQYPNQLRFAAAMGNIGEGPLEIITTTNWYCKNELVKKEDRCVDGSFPTNNVQQVIYQLNQTGTMDYDTIKSGTLFFDDSPGHNHYHVKNWANFRLLKKKWWTKNPYKWKEVASSEKVSYCLFDNKICTKENQYCELNNTIYSYENLANYGLGRYVSCNSTVQGISVGGIDYYGMFYEGQSIDLPENIKKGKYFLFIEVDPNDEYLEKNEKNNSVLFPIEIN